MIVTAPQRTAKVLGSTENLLGGLKIHNQRPDAVVISSVTIPGRNEQNPSVTWVTYEDRTEAIFNPKDVLITKK